jgi:hypothetical protein
MAQELARAEVTAQNEVTNATLALARDKKYGYTPREKPVHSVRIVMENFNSLRIMFGNAKVNAINN